MKKNKTPFVALGSRLKGLPEVLTLGVRPNFLDYNEQERDLIYQSDIILYPSLTYAQLFKTMGKKIFPSLETYLYADDKIKQTTLFYLNRIPHPRTRIYFHLHFEDILNDFHFPFVAKVPRASSQGRGIFKITHPSELEMYLKYTHVAYIQEFIPHDRDLRVILIDYRPVLAYWRLSAQGNFRTNLFQGGAISFENIPERGLRSAERYARLCKFNDVGLDLIWHKGVFLLMEANMIYGRKALNMKGLDPKDIIRNKLISGELQTD